MHEWLALLPVGYPKDADVKAYPSVAEGYDYDCYRVSPDASDDCYHDIANGIMVGWFLWAETISRRALGLSTEVDVDCLATSGSVQTDGDATTAATSKTDDNTAMHTTSVAFGDDGQMVITARNTVLKVERLVNIVALGTHLNRRADFEQHGTEAWLDRPAHLKTNDQVTVFNAGL